jgi:hypothetical protein
MPISAQLAKHFRDVYFGGNWTVSNLSDMLKDVDWKTATGKVGEANSIAMLTYHVDYFVVALLNALKNRPLDSKDSLSFNHPPINSESDWQKMLDLLWKNATEAASLIEKLPDERLALPFVDEKYGTWFRNIAGIIEHTHYHLGQIALIKKQLR